jgi:hypothetical protein
VYQDQINGFQLDYPAGWTVLPNTQIGPRGSQAQLLSPGATPQALAEGDTNLSVTVYLWDPKNDLAAYVTHRRTAWEGGGFTIVRESKGDLMDGRKEMDFVVRAPDGQPAYFLFTNLGENYLEIAGEGGISLVEEIAHTLRPLNFKP